MNPPVRLNLYDFTREELRAQFVRWDFSPVHAERLWNYLYLQLAESCDASAMPELPEKVRARLAAGGKPDVLPTALATDSSDGFTRKYLLSLADGERIEADAVVFNGDAAALSAGLLAAAACAGQMFSSYIVVNSKGSPVVHVGITTSMPEAVQVAAESFGYLRDQFAENVSRVTNNPVIN